MNNIHVIPQPMTPDFCTDGIFAMVKGIADRTVDPAALFRPTRVKCGNKVHTRACSDLYHTHTLTLPESVTIACLNAMWPPDPQLAPKVITAANIATLLASRWKHHPDAHSACKTRAHTLGPVDALAAATILPRSVILTLNPQPTTVAEDTAARTLTMYRDFLNGKGGPTHPPWAQEVKAAARAGLAQLPPEITNIIIALIFLPVAGNPGPSPALPLHLASWTPPALSARPGGQDGLGATSVP